MEREHSVDSQDEEAVENEEEKDLLPDVMDDTFFSGINQQSLQRIKRLQATGDLEQSIEFQKLHLICQRLRRENLAKNQEIGKLKTETEAAQRQLVNAENMSQVDNLTISKLKEEMEKAWQLIDAAQSREQVAQEQVSLLREKLEQLETEAAKRSSKKDGGDELGPNLAAHRENILKDRDRISAEVEELNRRLQIQRLYTDEIERKRSELEAKNKELYKLVDDASGEAYKEKRSIDILKDKLATVTGENTTLNDEIKDLKTQNDNFVANNVQQNMQILALKSNLERKTNQCTGAINKLAKSQSDVEHLQELKDTLQHELNHVNSVLKLKEEEATKLKSDLAKIEKSNESLHRKLQTNEVARNKANDELSKIKAAVSLRSKDDTVKSKAEDEKHKKMQLILKERKAFQIEVPKLQRKIREAEENVTLASHEIRALKEEIKQKNLHLQKFKSVISKIEMERDRNAEETQILEDKIDSLNEELRFKEEYVTELKDIANNLNTNIAKLQGLLEITRTERNTFEKQLQSCVEEVGSLKAKLATNNHKLEQSLEKVRSKDAELLRQQKNLDKIEKEFQKARIEFRNLEVILQNSRSELKEKRIENERLYKTLADHESRQEKIQKQLDCVIHEKDLTGTQLIKRNNEIDSLKNEMHASNLALQRSEKQYAERVEDIRLLKIEIQNLMSQRHVLSRGLANTADMRQEVLSLHRTLNQERVKAKALEEEMLTPMNVHRWRTLAGRDPERLALIQKIQNLQKRILSQSVTSAEREYELRESHKMHEALREFMLKLPSYKIKERLGETQHALHVRDKQLKALAAELNAKALDEKSKDFIVDELRSNLEMTKKELNQEKKKKQKLIKECQTIRQIHSYSAPTACIRMAGAGFRMLQSS